MDPSTCFVRTQARPRLTSPRSCVVLEQRKRFPAKIFLPIYFEQGTSPNIGRCNELFQFQIPAARKNPLGAPPPSAAAPLPWGGVPLGCVFWGVPLGCVFLGGATWISVLRGATWMCVFWGCHLDVCFGFLLTTYYTYNTCWRLDPLLSTSLAGKGWRAAAGKSHFPGIAFGFFHVFGVSFHRSLPLSRRACT